MRTGLVLRAAAVSIALVLGAVACGNGNGGGGAGTATPAEDTAIGELAVASGGAVAADGLPPFRRYVRIIDCAEAATDAGGPGRLLVDDPPPDVGEPVCFLGVPEGQPPDPAFDTYGALYVPSQLSVDATLTEILDGGGLLVEADPDGGRRGAAGGSSARDAEGRRYSVVVDVQGHRAVVNRPFEQRYGISWAEGDLVISMLGNHSPDELVALARRLRTDR